MPMVFGSCRQDENSKCEWKPTHGSFWVVDIFFAGYIWLWWFSIYRFKKKTKWFNYHTTYPRLGIQGWGWHADSTSNELNFTDKQWDITSQNQPYTRGLNHRFTSGLCIPRITHVQSPLYNHPVTQQNLYLQKSYTYMGSIFNYGFKIYISI